MAHLLGQIDHRAIGPALLGALAVIADDFRVAGNLAWLKGWRHQLALVTVKIALAADQAITNRRAHNLMERRTFIERIGVLHKNTLNMLWFIKENAWKRAKVDAADIGSTRHALEKPQAISGKIWQVAQQWNAFEKVKRFRSRQVCREMC